MSLDTWSLKDPGNGQTLKDKWAKLCVSLWIRRDNTLEDIFLSSLQIATDIMKVHSGSVPVSKKARHVWQFGRQSVLIPFMSTFSHFSPNMHKHHSIIFSNLSSQRTHTHTHPLPSTLTHMHSHPFHFIYFLILKGFTERAERSCCVFPG